MALLRDAPDDLFALTTQAADAHGLPAEFIEKDFWICELIRSIAKPVDDAAPIFKGGTSLSKAFQLIDRFSEDVDILVHVTRKRDSTFGKGSIDNILKFLCARVGEDLGIPESDQDPVTSGKGEHKSVRYKYPARLASEILTQGVLLEMGVRGGPEPHDRRKFRSFVAQFAVENAGAGEEEYEELAPVEIDVLAPERTLIEKLAMLHGLGSRFPKTSDQLLRAGRHYYDIYKLLTSESILNVLAVEPSPVVVITEDINRISEEFGWPFTPRPEDGYSTSPAFRQSHDSFQIAKQGYEAALDLVYGHKPSFEDCLKAVEEHRKLL